MQRLSAIALSLLLFWGQVSIMASPTQADTWADRSCCSCKRASCCVARPAPGSAPLPLATAPTISQSHTWFSLTTSPAWILPRGEVEVFSFDSSARLTAAPVPLFQRDCARLI
jgi:hypothetical protein